MGIYVYKATDSKGKIVKGELDAKDELEVSTQLAKLGYVPINISFRGEKAPSIMERFFKKAVKTCKQKDLIVFTRQFSTLVKTAVPIMEGLSVLAEQSEDDALKEALHQVIHDIEEGNKLSEAMAKHPGVFNDLYCNTVVAGEAGGVLDKVLMRLADVLEEEAATKNEIKGALQYPIMVTVALFIALYIMSVAVLPQFMKMYSGLGAKLPLPTQVMVVISIAFRKYWWLTFPVIAAVPASLKFLVNTPVGRVYWDEFKFKAPVFGKVYIKIVMLRFASMLSVLYQAGLPILRILDIIKVTIGNVVLAKDIDSIKRDVADGKGISGGILASKLFPRLVGYMVSIGEKTGSLSTMLDSLCQYYTAEVRNAMKTLTALIEPLMTAVMGVVVMGMALAVFMPMWNLISVMRQ